MTFTVPTPPSANDWHRTVNGHPILSRVARLYPLAVAKAASEQGVEKITKPRDVWVHIRWFRARKSGDVDKRGAILLDALQGIAYDNDSQIQHYAIERDDSDPKHPRMEVTVTAL